MKRHDVRETNGHPAPDAPVRVGVTGHRYLAELPRLRAAVELALDEIERAFGDRPLVAVSALAEGADRLVAEAVLERGGRLRAVLPFPVEDYVTDFEGEDSRAEFARLLDLAEDVTVLPAADTRDEGYEQVGIATLEACDALIAVWDGRPAQGRGGTAEVVSVARKRDMPVLHIKAGNRVPGTHTPTTLGEEQGELVVHNL